MNRNAVRGMIKLVHEIEIIIFKLCTTVEWLLLFYWKAKFQENYVC